MGLLLTVTLAYGGAALALFRPFYGLLVYVCFAIVRPEDMWPWSVQDGNYSRIIAVSMLIGWVWRTLPKTIARRRGSAEGLWVVGLFVGYWLWAGFLALSADNAEVAWEHVEALSKILLPLIVGITTIDSVKKLKGLAWTIVVSQGYVAFEMNRYYFSGYNKLRIDGFGTLDNNCAVIGMVTVIGLAAFMFLNARKYWQKAIILACSAFMAHAVLFSFSRGGMLGLIVCAGVGFVLLKKSLKHYVAFAIACGMVISATGPEVRARFLRTFEHQADGRREASAQSRLDLWEDCWVVFQRDPLMGCGPNHWPLLAHTFGWERGKEAHSLWIQTATETGLPGIAMFAGFYVVCMLRLFLLMRRSDEDDDPWFSDSAKMVIAALAGFGVSAQFVSLELLEVPYYVCLLGAATLSVYARERRLVAQADECEDGYESEWDDKYADGYDWAASPAV